MAVYVMSDIHGEMDKFEKMLEKIEFMDEDHLYIIGDVVDRGPYGVELLSRMKDTKNITMLLGNHEYMCLQYFAKDATPIDKYRWNKNGNSPTLKGFSKLTKEKKEELLDYIDSLPSHLEVTVNNHSFYLVHGFVGDSKHDEVWTRPSGKTNPFKDKTVIIGHTPVCNLFFDNIGADAYLKRLADAKEHLRIYHHSQYIDIDCLCGYLRYPARSLACLRLDDMKEFYVDEVADD